MDKKSIDFFYMRNKKLNNLQEEKNNLKLLNNKLKLNNKELNWQFENLKKHFKTLNDTYNDLNINFLSLIEDNEHLNRQIQRVKQENEKYANEIKSMNEKNEKYANEIKSLKIKLKRANKENKYDTLDFINFQEFLAKSYICPIVESPFVHEDKRIFAFMDHIGKLLRKNVLTNNYKPLVSVILPHHNNIGTAYNSIVSVLNQTYSNFELIIINESCDTNYNLLETFNDERIRVLHNNKNKNISHSYNLGLKNAKGTIIMYLNPFNEWDYKYMETMIGAFIELPDADALYSGQYLYEYHDSKPHSAHFASYNKSLLHNHNFIDLNCFCHKTKILNEIKCFDESLWDLSNWDFILKISNMFKIYSIPIILSKKYKYCIDEKNSNNSLNYLEISKKILNRNKIPLKKYKPLNKRISIIIPSYESLNEIKMCLDSILSYGSEEMLDIIVVDNNSKENVKEYLTNLKSEGKINLILNDINYGFSFAINQGISISRKDSDLLLLNNDAILTKGSLEHMQYCAYSIPNCGLIVPHEILFEGNNAISKHVPYADNNFECDVTPSKLHHNIINMPTFHDGNLLELNFAPFFCTYIKRDIYNKTLGLDSELGRHYRSDRIFSDFIRHILQLKIYQSPNAFVYHKHQIATNKLKEKKEEYDYIFNKNQWQPELAKELGFKKSIWDY